MLTSRRRITGPLLAAALLAGTAVVPAVHAGDVLDGVRARKVVRVCVSTEYPGIGWRHPQTGKLVGLDIDLSQALASDLGVGLRHVVTTPLTLSRDLLGGECDVAMLGLAVSPERLRFFNFSRPYLGSDVYAVTSVAGRVVRNWEDLDRPGVRVGVRAGSYLDSVVLGRLRHAKLVRVEPPQVREHELASGRIDAFLANHARAQSLAQEADWIRLVRPAQPFHPIFHAYPVRPGDDQWMDTINSFVERTKRDGRLAGYAQRHGLNALLIP